MFKQMHWRLLVVIATFAIYPYAKDKDTLTVIASGETHAMLQPCDCPVEPGGGLAKRAHAIKSLTKGNTLLFDAGGFSGGGLYDSYTEGRAIDSLRTLATISAMAAMHYDAAAVGDDDLQFGAHWLVRAASAAGLPLVSANCMSADSSPLAAPYIIVKKGGLTYAVTGLTTQEKLFTFPEPVVIRAPLSALRKIWPDMKKKADFLIVLSHLGEEMTRRVADSFPDCDIIVNGHRKNSTQSAVYVGRSLFMQFGFAGKNLSRAALIPGKGGLSLVKSDWIPITPEVPDDPEIAKLIDLMIAQPSASAIPPKRETVLDLYIMSRCPYGLKALKELTDALPSFPKAEWAVHFIGSQEADSSLSSLHGEGEVRDEMLWLAVQALYPGRWVEFLRARAAASETTSTEIITKKLGLDNAALKAWAAVSGRQELLMHYNRSTRLGVQASPTLLANNSPVDMEITKPRIGKMLCSQTPGSSAYCDSIPECFDHRDCKKAGKVGACVQSAGKAHCEYKEAVRFTFTLLMPDSMISHPEHEIITTTRDLFEGAVIDTVSIRSDAGRKLLADFRPKALPYYLFDKKVFEADNFSQIEQGLEPKNDKFVFKEGYVKKAYFHNRPIIPGTCDVYIDPMFPGVKDAISAVLHYRGSVRLHVYPLLSISPDIDSISSGDRLGREEAQRWLLFSEQYPAKYLLYLESYLKRKDASYWFLSLGDLKIKTDDFVARIKANNGGMRDLWKTMTELGLSGPVELVVGNREVVRVKSQKEMGELLALLGK